MVTPEGRVKIMDFGLAKLKGATKLTSTGSTLGTVAYMSPEQAQAMEVDQRSDIFSFGVVLYEMITGHLPFGGDHEAAVVYSIVNETPEPLARYKSNVPEGLQRIVEKALIKDREERYQHIDGVLADLRHGKRTMEYATAGRIPSKVTAPKPKRSRLPVIIPAAIIILAVVLFFIFKPFQIKIGFQPEAIAQENSLAIMYFENLADREDEDRLGEIVTNLLITDLSESQYVRVVSSQRLYDILKLLGREGVKIIDREVATEVANRANAKYMLLGNILQVEPNVVLTSQLVEVAGGKVLASQRITGGPGEQVFSLVDRLTVEVKKDLSLPQEAQHERDPQIADVTTSSPQAYRHYVEGVDLFYKAYRTEALNSFRKALEYDSTFAMAYYRLAMLGDEQEKALIAKAAKFSDGLSRKEKLYIKHMEHVIAGNFHQAIAELERITERYPDEKEAFLWSGYYYGNYLSDDKQAVQRLSKAIEIDPLYKIAYNMLAYMYNDLGDFDKSIWAINKYISLAPDEANPYDSRGDLYAYNGKLDSAIESYEKALEIKPDFFMSQEKLGHIYLFKRDYAEAERYYQKLASGDQKLPRSMGRTFLALIPLHQGKFDEALEILDHGLAADRMERSNDWQEDKHFLKATIYREKKDLQRAVAEIERTVEVSMEASPDYTNLWRTYHVQFLAQAGEFEKGGEVAEILKEHVEDTDYTTRFFYWFARAFIEQARGDHEKAIAYLENKDASRKVTRYYLRHMLARMYLESGRLAESVDMFERTLLRYSRSRAIEVIAAVKTHYYLGQAYERSGWTDKAVEQYEIFLDIWKDADEGIAEVEQAKQRVVALRITSAD
jgi:tetratricopeptide (TPR) repeat protein